MEQQSSIRDFDRQPRNGTVGHNYKQPSERGTAEQEAEEEEEGQECVPGDRSSGDRRRRRPASGGRPCGSGMPVESFTRGGRSTAQHRTPRRPRRGSSQATGLSCSQRRVVAGSPPRRPVTCPLRAGDGGWAMANLELSGGRKKKKKTWKAVDSEAAR